MLTVGIVFLTNTFVQNVSYVRILRCFEASCNMPTLRRLNFNFTQSWFCLDIVPCILFLLRGNVVEIEKAQTEFAMWGCVFISTRVGSHYASGQGGRLAVFSWLMGGQEAHGRTRGRYMAAHGAREDFSWRSETNWSVCDHEDGVETSVRPSPKQAEPRLHRQGGWL